MRRGILTSFIYLVVVSTLAWVLIKLAVDPFVLAARTAKTS